MWLLIFVGAYVFASANGETVFRKCCSRDNSLVAIKNDGDENFECLDRETIENNYNVSQAPLFISDSVTVVDGIPNYCDDLRLKYLSAYELDNGLLNSADYCYDRLILEITNGSKSAHIPKIVALTCIQNDTEMLPDNSLSIDHIRKCCKTGQSYDAVNHLCRNDLESTEEWLVEYLNVSSDVIYAVQKGLHCKADEYGVELSEELYSIEVEGSSLRVAKRNGEGGGLAQRGEWCVDRDTDARLVARVCTRNCSNYGAYCLRKCCPIGQHYKTRRCGSFMSMCVSSADEEIPFDIDVYLDPLKEQNGAGFAGE